jgi:hypothetical protein
MACDRKDRHALAAAVRDGAEVLVTFNIGDLPDTSTSCDDITVVYPDDFLLDQLDLYRRHYSGAARPSAQLQVSWDGSRGPARMTRLRRCPEVRAETRRHL